MAIKHSLVDYSKIVNDSEHRNGFIKNATDFILDNRFDGLDLFLDLSTIRDHSHHPGSLFTEKYSDKDAIIRFAKELKQSLHGNNKTLTAAFTGINTDLAKSLNVTALSEHLDLLNFVPMYDFRGHSGNVALDTLNATKTEQFFDNLIKSNVLSSKIVIGVSFLGHSFTHKTDSIQFEDTWGASHACEMSRKLKVANLFIKKGPQQKTAKFYSLESEHADSIRLKVEFIKSRNLAGITAFPVNFDDFLEECDESDSKSAFADQQIAYPLLWTINKAISKAFLQSHETEVNRN
ncbi:probable chitinase 10 [Sitodiplosis mosellana]|uniref:probable chitinase 10 n=1 Tax=Sitodiplosis mosellana TaxID=263140 RepID=UPI002443D181|nr:probable chitinase 10 [Sitodiplosis mosellana]